MRLHSIEDAKDLAGHEQTSKTIREYYDTVGIGVSAIHFRCTALLEKSALAAYQMPTHSFSVTTIRERSTQDTEPK
jgi:hypothetical protein